jgi:hypothetical protein
MARIKIQNLLKGKKTTHKELKKKQEKPLGEPVDVAGVAGGGKIPACGCIAMPQDPTK